MASGIGTLTSAVITRELPPSKRLPIVALGTVVPDPIAAATAIIALQRHRAEGGRDGEEALEPEMVQVPSLVGQQRDAAVDQLNKLKLKATIVPHVSASNLKGQVFRHQPAAEQWVPVDSSVKLDIHDGPPRPREESLEEAVKGAREDIAALRYDLQKLREAADLAANTLAANPGAKAGTGAAAPAPPPSPSSPGTTTGTPANPT